MKSKAINSLLVTLTLLVCSSCDLLKMKGDAPEPEAEKRAVARVNDNYLYEEDLVSLVSEGISAGDSLVRIENFIKSWVKKQLMIDEADRKMSFDEADIERKILDYRYALMVHAFQEDYVIKNLDKNVTSQEISEYYKENIDNFALKQNIIKGILIKLPKEAPELGNFRRLFRSNKAEEREELRSYCFRFAEKYSLDDSVWVNFDEVVGNTPFAGEQNKGRFLKNTKQKEQTEGDFIYFLKIMDKKLSGEISPLEFVQDDIEKIITLKRRVELADGLENDIYNKAKKDKSFEIYTNE